MTRRQTPRRDAGRGLVLGRGRIGEGSPGFHARADAKDDALVAYAGDAHLLTIAPTGAGKGVGCVIPNALLYPGPLLVFDPKGEAYAITRRQRERLGQKVVLLDVFGITGEPADALNPLDLAGLIDPGRPEDAAASLATLLTGGQVSHKDPFWDITSHAFLTGLLTWLLTDCPPEERRFSRLYTLFSEGDLSERLAVMLDSGEMGNLAARAEIAAFLSHPSRETRPSVQSTARQHLPLFGSSAVRAATDRTSFDLGDLVEGRPLSLFIIVPPTKLVSHRPLLRLWLGTLILALAARCQRRSKNQPRGGAKVCHFLGWDLTLGMDERLGPRALHVAGAGQGALALRGQSAGGQASALVFRALLWLRR